MADQVLRVRDSGGTVRDLAVQLPDGSWAVNVGGQLALTTAQINVLAKDSTLLSILAQLDDNTSDTVLSVLKQVLACLPTSLNGDGGLKVHTQNPIDISTLATEATLQTLVAKLPSALNGDGGLKVHVQNPTTNPETGLAKETTLGRRFGSGKIVTAARVSASGDNTVITPTTGKSLRVFWIGLSTPEANTSEVLTIVKIGSSIKYRWNMTAPGAFSHWDVLEGSVDELLIVNLSAAKNVDVNVTYEEF